MVPGTVSHIQEVANMVAFIFCSVIMGYNAGEEVILSGLFPAHMAGIFPFFFAHKDFLD